MKSTDPIAELFASAKFFGFKFGYLRTGGLEMETPFHSGNPLAAAIVADLDQQISRRWTEFAKYAREHTSADAVAPSSIERSEPRIAPPDFVTAEDALALYRALTSAGVQFTFVSFWTSSHEPIDEAVIDVTTLSVDEWSADFQAVWPVCPANSPTVVDYAKRAFETSGWFRDQMLDAHGTAQQEAFDAAEEHAGRALIAMGQNGEHDWSVPS